MRTSQVALTMAAALLCACDEPSKTVLGDIRLAQFENGYYLRDLRVDRSLQGWGPIDALGWTDRVVAACVDREGCRVVDSGTHDGWKRVLSRGEVAAMLGGSVELITPDEAWRKLGK